MVIYNKQHLVKDNTMSGTLHQSFLGEKLTAYKVIFRFLFWYVCKREKPQILKYTANWPSYRIYIAT